MTDTFVLSIGGILIDVELQGLPGLALALADRYEAFQDPVGGEDVDLRLRLAARTAAPEAGREPGPPRVEVVEGGRRVSRSDFAVTLRERGVQGYEADGELRDSIYPFDTLLRVLLTEVLPERGGFLVHGCALLLNEDSSGLFHGVSESGKTTLAMRAGKPATLTDEISLLRKRGEAWMLHGTPFWGDFVRAGQNIAAPLRVLAHFQPPRGRIVDEPMSAGRMVFALMRDVLNFSTLRAREESLLALMQDVCASVPCIGFAFGMTESWQSIQDRLLNKAPHE